MLRSKTLFKDKYWNKQFEILKYAMKDFSMGLIRNADKTDQTSTSSTKYTPVLSIDTINPQVTGIEYAIRGPIPARANQFAKELAAGEKKPFTEVIKLNLGDCHAMGQKPITFIREVLALALYDPLFDNPDISCDAKNRAQEFLDACVGHSIGSYTGSLGRALVRKQVAKYIERRDGIPSDYRLVSLSSGGTEAIKALFNMLRNDTGPKPNGVMICIPTFPLYTACMTLMHLYEIDYFLDEDHGFNEVLVVCVCLLSVIRTPTVMSAPASRNGSDRMNSHPKWINPCGSGASDDFDGDLDIVPRLNDDELLTSIVVAAKNALMHAEHFKEDYVKNTFNLDFNQIHQDWKTLKYKWLPSSEEISKSLGEHVPIEQLEKLELDMALKDTYKYLQKFAVGLEQVVWDQNDHNGPFKDEFADIEFKLRATLCEIQAAMIERNVSPHKDISRQIMDNELRHIGNSSFRNVRDWVIFRDCMNGLEYVIQVFEYFKQKLTS